MNQAKRDDLQYELNHMLFQIYLDQAIQRLLETTYDASGVNTIEGTHQQGTFKFTWSLDRVKQQKPETKN